MFVRGRFCNFVSLFRVGTCLLIFRVEAKLFFYCLVLVIHSKMTNIVIGSFLSRNEAYEIKHYWSQKMEGQRVTQPENKHYTPSGLKASHTESGVRLYWIITKIKNIFIFPKIFPAGFGTGQHWLILQSNRVIWWDHDSVSAWLLFIHSRERVCIPCFTIDCKSLLCFPVLSVKYFVMVTHRTKGKASGLGLFASPLQRIWLSPLDWFIVLECSCRYSWIILKKAENVQVI